MTDLVRGKVFDSFNRLDRVPMGFADTGQEWIGSDANWQIKDKKAQRINNNGYQSSRLDIALVDGLVEAKIDVKIPGWYGGLCARMVDSLNGYIAMIGLANRLTANQSSAETDVSGWNPSAGTFDRSQNWASHGAWSFRLTGTAANQMVQAFTNGNQTPVIEGRTYTTSVDFRAATVPRLAELYVAYQDKNSVVVGGQAVARVNDSTVETRRVSTTTVAPPGAIHAYVVVRIFGLQIGESHYFDRIQIIEGSSTNWVIGGRPPVQNMYAWVNNGGNQLASIGPDIWDHGDVLGFRVVGRKLEALRNGIVVATVADNGTFLKSGGWGLFGLGEQDGVIWDNYQITEASETDSVRKDGQYEFNGLLMNSGAVQVTQSEGLFELPDVKSSGDTEMGDFHGGLLGKGDLLTMRQIILELGASADTIEELHAYLRVLNEKFQPRNDLIPLVYQRAGLNKRYILVRPRKLGGFLTSCEMAMSKISRGAVLLVAPDPRILSFTEKTKDITIAAGLTSGQDSVVMEGNFEGGAWPILEIAGPATNPRIFNSTVNRTIRIDHVISAGQVLIVDVKNRMVTKAGGDVFSSVRNDNQWWNLIPGRQTIAYSRLNAPANTSTLTVRWRDSYAS